MKVITIIFLIFFTSTVQSINLDIPEEKYKDYECMAKNLYHEANGEPTEGIVAVANVVLNRVSHENYPDSICGVIYQKNQFSWVSKRKHITLNKISNKIKWIAFEAVLNKSWEDNTKGAMFFHTISNKNSWNKRLLQQTTRIGNHVFFRHKD